MEEKFVVKPKKQEKKISKTVTITVRVDKEMQEELDSLALKSDRSRNELMCMALRYALDHLEFIPETKV